MESGHKFNLSNYIVDISTYLHYVWQYILMWKMQIIYFGFLIFWAMGLQNAGRYDRVYQGSQVPYQSIKKERIWLICVNIVLTTIKESIYNSFGRILERRGVNDWKSVVYFTSVFIIFQILNQKFGDMVNIMVPKYSD